MNYQQHMTKILARHLLIIGNCLGQAKSANVYHYVLGTNKIMSMKAEQSQRNLTASLRRVCMVYSTFFDPLDFCFSWNKETLLTPFTMNMFSRVDLYQTNRKHYKHQPHRAERRWSSHYEITSTKTAASTNCARCPKHTPTFFSCSF